MKPYRLKHVPTGMYYQPQKHRGSHLSSKGKVYQTASHGLSERFLKGEDYTFYVWAQENSQVHKKTMGVLNWESTNNYREVKALVKVSDWIKEEVVANDHNVLLGRALSLLKEVSDGGLSPALKSEINTFLKEIKKTNIND